MGVGERLLLRAAILDQPRAEAAWKEFCRLEPDIEKLENGLYRYFPLIAGKLAGATKPVTHVSRLQSVSRHSWARRQQELAKLIPLFQEFEKQGIEFVLLKGLALSFFYRPYRGESSGFEAGLLLREEDLRRALPVWKAQGWSASPTMEDDIGAGRRLRLGPEIVLRRNEGENLSLHPRLFRGPILPRARESLWRKAGTVEILGARIKLLHPLHQFLETCARGVRQREAFPWLTDAAQLLGGGVPWRRLELVAHHFGVVASLRRTLLALDELGFSLPPETVKYWRGMVTGNEFAEDGFEHEQRLIELDGRLRYAEARINRIEGSPPLRRHHVSQRTQFLAEDFLRHRRGVGLVKLWRESIACMRSEHHLRPYNRRARFLWLVTRGHWRAKS